MVVKLNEIMVWDTNLPLSADKFFEKFVDYIIFSLIDFFSDYD